MDKKHINCLNRNQVYLVENLKTGDGLYDALITLGLLRQRNKSHFMNPNVHTTRESEVGALNAHIQTCGKKAFDKFLEAMKETGQGEIADDLLNNVGCAHAVDADVAVDAVDAGAAVGASADEVQDTELQLPDVPTGDPTDDPLHTLRNDRQEGACGESGSLPAEPKQNPPANDKDEDIVLDETDSPIEISVTDCTEEFYEKHKANSYAMDHKPRGIAVIVNVNTIIGHDPRDGTDVDRENLCRLWTALGFKIEAYNDEDGLTVQGIKQKLENLSKSKELDEAQCLIVCLLSHGEDGKILGTDAKTVEIKILQEYFNNEKCPALQNKPKLWFIQACRGGNQDEGVEFEVKGDSDLAVADATGLQPTWTDDFVSYSTTAGYVAWRNRKTGSYFIQAVVKVFQKYADTEDLSAMNNKVNDVVSMKVASRGDEKSKSETVTSDGGWNSKSKKVTTQGECQISEQHSRMRKMHFYFFPGIYKS